MNKRSHIHKKADSSASNPVRSQFHSRPFIAQAQPHSLKPLSQTEIEDQEFQQHKFEATRLQTQAKYDTITPEGQERLTVLQAKMSDLLQRRLEHASRFERNFANIPISRPDASSQQAVQTKLTIGEPGDKYEQEADRVASQVVNQINAPVSQQAGQNMQREEICEEEKDLQMKPMLQLRAAVGGMTATAELETGIKQARSGGQPLAANIRQPMEQAFGADFSKVKVHTDSRADQLNRSVQARAFTTGQDVFFRQGEYAPASRGGQELIAHELTHVVQQNGGAVQRVQKQATHPPSLSCRGDKLLQRSAAHFVTHPLPSCGNVMSYAVATSLAEGTIQRSTKYTTDFVKDESGQIDEDYFDTPGDQHTVIDDNFDDEYKDRLTQPTSESTVNSEVQKQSDTKVVLWRGTSTQGALAIESNSSAGGIAVNTQVTAPGRSDAQNQVARGGTFPEYTTNTGVASSFSFRRALVVIRIQAKYLARGSRSESGWIADRAAPVEVLQIVNRTLGLKELETPNASQ